jgi:hypothetical protein
MTSRGACVLLLAAGCGAKLSPAGDGVVDAGTKSPDARVWRDAAVVAGDAPADARPCMGGTMAKVAPDGSCLVFVSTPTTYVNAKAACTAMSAHLAFLKTAELDMAAVPMIGNLDTLIGATDNATEGTYLWDDGTAVVFDNWGAGEPNNGGVAGENCAIITGARPEKLWDDRPCNTSYAYLCHY